MKVITTTLRERGGNKSLFGENEFGEAIRARPEGDKAETPNEDDRLQEWARGLLTVAGRRRRNEAN